MHTYLIGCGIVLNLVFLWIIAMIILDKILAVKLNKKMVADKIRRQAQYQEELQAAKQAWQVWAKKVAELKQDYHKEDDSTKRFQLEMNLLRIQYEHCYYFDSINKHTAMHILGEENGWFLRK